MVTASNVEPWLRGPVAGIPHSLQPVAHALTAARDEVPATVDGLTASRLWLTPGGAASIGWHLVHLAGSTDRLFTAARGEAPSDAQRAALDTERKLPEPRPTMEELIQNWEQVVGNALRQLAETAEADLSAPRAVGRAQLPSTMRGLLFHAAEHAQRHVGQIVTTAKIVRGLGL